MFANVGGTFYCSVGYLSSHLGVIVYNLLEGLAEVYFLLVEQVIILEIDLLRFLVFLFLSLRDGVEIPEHRFVFLCFCFLNFAEQFPRLLMCPEYTQEHIFR